MFSTNSEELTNEQIDAASTYWAQLIVNGDGVSKNLNPKIVAAANRLNEAIDLSTEMPENVLDFMNQLRTLLQQNRKQTSLILRTEYGPQDILEQAATNAKIPKSVFLFKKTMTFDQKNNLIIDGKTISAKAYMEQYLADTKKSINPNK